jgi:alkanesulfonate monooxygenase SsuD/methylene tetrahydromethanopterin reductase-like flavin-dependent oxidoreductase (luciferase family)
MVAEPTEWQHIGDQIDATTIFARTDFVTVLWVGHCGGP